MLKLSLQHILSSYALKFFSKMRRNWLGVGWVEYRYFLLQNLFEKYLLILIKYSSLSLADMRSKRVQRVQS